jgi:hypothetical protein
MPDDERASLVGRNHHLFARQHSVVTTCRPQLSLYAHGIFCFSHGSGDGNYFSLPSYKAFLTRSDKLFLVPAHEPEYPCR